jgi:hypothetical protein
MLNRFKSLVCKKNQHLLRVKLSKDRELYGYVRDVADDYFVFQEVRKDAQGKARETSKMIRDLALVIEFGEISPDMLPMPFPMFGAV